MIWPAGETKDGVDLTMGRPRGFYYEGGGTRKPEDVKPKLGKANFAHPGANHKGVGSPGQACRGVYATMPRRMTEAERAAEAAEVVGGGHIDSWDGDRWRVSVNTALDDVPPGGGAFTLWPGSYLRAYDIPQTLFTDAPGRPSTRAGNPAHEAVCARIREDTTPVECFGAAGTVTFWHHKLTHNSSPNRSA